MVYIPPIAKGAMDGAPGRRFIGMIKATATADFSATAADFSATAAECAAFGRNDGVCGVGERNGNSNNKARAF